MKAVPSREEEILTEMCFSAGAQGLSEALEFRQDSQKYEPETVKSSVHNLEAFFEDSPSEDFLDRLRQSFPEIEFEVREEQAKDWLEEWKKGFEPFCLAGELWVVPTWRQPPEEAKSILWIDPGMAFGTGTHATTRMAAGLLAELDLNNCRVLDVGTGTAILAMAARQWGATELVATEIDPQARIVARENIERNKLDGIQVPDFQVEKVAGEFDLVIANIIDGVLVEIKDQLMSHVLPGGQLLLTGILQERESGFVSEFAWQDQGFQLLQRKTDEEWLGLLLKKESQ